jgi:hypothetical protein
MIDESKDDTSKYNEGLLQIQRLNNLWVRIENYAQNENYRPLHWKFGLDGVWRELAADAEKQSDSEQLFSENERLRKKIHDAKEPNQLYEALNERHIWLKLTQNKVGKGGAYKDRNEEDME